MRWVVPDDKGRPSSGVATYTLTEAERGHLAVGDLHKIPTAAERGIVYLAPDQRTRKLKEATYGAYMGRRSKA